jgi:hypothetical protein
MKNSVMFTAYRCTDSKKKSFDRRNPLGFALDIVVVVIAVYPRKYKSSTMVKASVVSG